MFEDLIKKLRTVENGYDDANEIANEIFNALKFKKLRILPELTTRQMKNASGLQKEKEKLREKVKEIAIFYNISGQRLQHILTCFTQLEKEKIIDLQRGILRKEEESNRALFRNQEYLKVLMTTTEAVVDSVIYLNEQKSETQNMFLDQKF